MYLFQTDKKEEKDIELPGTEVAFCLNCGGCTGCEGCTGCYGHGY